MLSHSHRKQTAHQKYILN